MRIAKALARTSHPNAMEIIPVAELSRNASELIRDVGIEQIDKSKADRSRMIASVAFISIIAKYIDSFIAYDYQVAPETLVAETWAIDAERLITESHSFAASSIQERASSFERGLLESIAQSESAAYIADELKAITIGLVVEYPHRKLPNNRFAEVRNALGSMIDAAS